MSYETLHSRLISLDEDTRLKGLWLIATAADAGIPLRISQGHRTLEEQAALYAQGRSDLDAVNVLRVKLSWPAIKNHENIKVTWAEAGSSWHNYHRAFDVVPMSDGTPDWLSPHWERIGAIGRALGMEWGGIWTKPDKPHFQNPQGIVQMLGVP